MKTLGLDQSRPAAGCTTAQAEWTSGQLDASLMDVACKEAGAGAICCFSRSSPPFSEGDWPVPEAAGYQCTYETLGGSA